MFELAVVTDLCPERMKTRHYHKSKMIEFDGSTGKNRSSISSRQTDMHLHNPSHLQDKGLEQRERLEVMGL